MRYFILTLSVLLLFVACNKKPKPVSTMETMLRTGKWKLSSATVRVRKPNGKDTTLDYFKFIPDCYKDDYYAFHDQPYGMKFNGSKVCDPSSPDSTSFSWTLENNNLRMKLYNGFDQVYGIVDTVQPFQLDTTSYGFDTVIGMLDTTVPPKQFIELDTIRKLFFSGVPAGSGPSGFTLGGFDISEADVISFSQASFSLHFQMISYYNDSTKWHGASFLLPLDHPDPDPNPGEYTIIRPDTFNYTFNFTNF